MDFFSGDVEFLPNTPGRRLGKNRIAALQPCNTTTPLPPSHPFANPPSNVTRRRPRPATTPGLDSPLQVQRSFLHKQYYFAAACGSRPHPEKETIGEDSFFISQCGRGMGVADGVGGWAELGVDSGEYSREMMTHAANYIQNTDCTDPQEILVVSYEGMQATGSSTSCIVVMDGNKIRASNLGDSGFIIFRYIKKQVRGSENDPSLHNSQTAQTPGKQQQKGKGEWRAVFRSEDQQHYFNCPRQLGTNSVDTPSDADTYTVECSPNDLVLLGTDGIFDNLSAREISQVLTRFQDIKEEDLYDVVNELVDEAFNASKDNSRQTPFARNAQVNGMPYVGGKMDDITVVLGIVRDRDSTACALDMNMLATPGRHDARRIIPGTPDTENSSSHSLSSHSSNYDDYEF